MRILITGSRGFIGGVVGRRAARESHVLLGVGRSSQPDLDWAGHYVQADVAHSDFAGIIGEFAPDVILHAAGSASVKASLASPMDDFRAAVLTWGNLLDSVRRSGKKPLLLFPSSAAVYGAARSLPIGEQSPIAPISPYGYHKVMCESLAQEYANCFGLNITVCRIFSLFGPAQRRLLVWELFAQLIASNPVVWLQGTGEESRDYLHVDDFTAAILGLAGRGMETREPGPCRIVNLAAGRETRVSELVEMLRQIVAPDKEIRYRGMAQAGDPQRWRADVTKLRAELTAWQPRSLLTGLTECVRAWQSTHPA